MGVPRGMYWEQRGVSVSGVVRRRVVSLWDYSVGGPLQL
jgi:hypothetical protein